MGLSFLQIGLGGGGGGGGGGGVGFETTSQFHSQYPCPTSGDCICTISSVTVTLLVIAEDI